MGKRIEVGYKIGIKDPLGESVKKKIFDFLRLKVDSVKTIEVYNIEKDIDDKYLKKISEEIFCDPIIQEYSYILPLAKDFDYLVEVGFKPGVTDNIGKTSSDAIKDMIQVESQIFTSKQYLITGKLTLQDVEKISSDLLANNLIENVIILTKNAQVKKIIPILPKVESKLLPKINLINLNVSDEELLEISKQGVLALTLQEMNLIQAHFQKLKRNPTDAELEVIAQTWSEHCKHKIFNAIIHYDDGKKKIFIDSLFKSYIQKATDEISKKTNFLVSVFKDNAGIIKFNKDYNIVFKVETHNSPSALDPYGGALTGIVGVNRDVLGTGIGARPIFNTDIFCFANPEYDEKIPSRLLHPKRIFDGVRKGVEHGGNKSGIPTVNGCIVFDKRFLGKPLVYCGTGGIMPSKINNKDTSEKLIESDDLIIMSGGRVGKDGIHGATFSSEALHKDSPVTAVQIGDPITQKKMLDFILEARDLGIIKSITDNGAGGLSSSVGELCQLSGGAELSLEKVPLKYPGLNPWEILVSEAQERMTIGISKKDLDKFLLLSEKHEVESTVIGKFTNTKRFQAFYNNEKVIDLDIDFLHNGLPKMRLKAKWKKITHSEPNFALSKDLSKELLNLLSRPNICSKESTLRQYDHEVQGQSVIKPFTGKTNDGPSDAAVIRPILASDEGVVVANGIIPRYSDIDTYHMTKAAFDEAVRNHISVGGDLDILSALDNFCWCDPVRSDKTPDGEYKLAQLVRANQALYDYCINMNIPLISGKDSMKNDYMIGDTKISIPPTVLISTIGKISDAKKAVTMDAKNPKDLVYVVGKTKNELGGSEYFASRGFIGNNVPVVDEKIARKTYIALNNAIKLGLVASCHDCSDGGLGVALAETSFSGGLGMTLDLTNMDSDKNLRDDYLLFSETQSRFVVTIKPKDKKRFEETMKDTSISLVGITIKASDFIIKRNKKIIVKIKIEELKKAWQKTLAW